MESPELKYIGKKLRQLREAGDLTQAQFAKKVGLTQAAISQFEDGKRIPSTQALQKITSALNLSMDDLIINFSSDEVTEGKKEAIDMLVAKLRNEKVDKNEIIALNRFIDARLGLHNKGDGNG